MPKPNRFRLWRDITWLTQLGISMVAPLFLCIWGAWQLQTRLGLGPWVMLAGILLGMGGAAGSGSYIFEPLPLGVHRVTNNSTGVARARAYKRLAAPRWS